MNEEYALMKNAKGSYVLGYGPFIEYATQPDVATAFYVNDFSLTDETPWKVPTRVKRLGSLKSSLSISLKSKWIQPELAPFAQVFSEVNASLLRNEIQKSVPVVAESGELTEGNAADLIFSVTPHHLLNAYAWSASGKGFCGLTPEVLFSYEKGRLRTMALAGTATLEERDVFAVDEKEILEHEFVAQMLISKLSEIGMVQPETRGIMELDSLVHFYTPIYVGLYDSTSIESLIQRLHPTPALGVLPRTQEALENLVEWRERLHCPAHFGAPMGVYDEGEFHSVVCIRGIHWNEKKLSLPAGCGVIEASRLTSEWRELQLKRDSVKALFGL